MADESKRTSNGGERAHDDGSNGADGGGDEGKQPPGTMMLNHPLKERWIQYPIIVLGLWLMASPATFGYGSTAMAWSDIITGAVLIALASLTLFARNPWGSYANAFVGLWLLMAPLVFHAPTAEAYLNDTIVGILVITFTVIVMMRMEMGGPSVPPGWSYNPSTGMQRAPLIALGLVGFFISRYLAAYQLGYIDAAWDPFFGNGTAQILTSRVSKAFPVSDAGLGAVAYAIETLMGFMGDESRWRTMPWMVSFFGIVVIPLGFVQILLIILQPVLVGTWCTLCLLSAFAMLWMISLTVDEVVAMGQFLVRRTRRGDSLWHAFWMGGRISKEEAGSEETRPDPGTAGSMFWGASVPWYLLGAMALGFWLMLSPAVFGTSGLVADSSHLVGALAVSFAVIATGEPARFVRLANVPLGAWTVVAPWIFGGEPLIAAANAALAGGLLVLVSLPRGTIRDRYGGWERYVASHVPDRLRDPLGGRSEQV